MREGPYAKRTPRGRSDLMPIEVVCVNGHQLRVKDESAGKKVRCPSCREVVRVPLPDPGGSSDSPGDLSFEALSALGDGTAVDPPDAQPGWDPIISTPSAGAAAPPDWQPFAWLGGVIAVTIVTVVGFAVSGAGGGTGFLLFVSCAAWIAAVVLLLIAAFKVSVGWGLASLFIPIAKWVFLFTKYPGSKAPIAAALVAPLVLWPIWIVVVVWSVAGSATEFVREEVGDGRTTVRDRAQTPTDAARPRVVSGKPGKPATKSPARSADNAVAGARKAMRAIIDAKPGRELAECLTNESAAGMSMGLFMMAGMMAGMSPKAEMKADLAALSGRYGMDFEQNADPQALMVKLKPRGRAALAELFAFLEKWSDGKGAPPMNKMPRNLDGLSFTEVDATTVRIAGPTLPGKDRSCEARFEDGKWRIHVGGLGSLGGGRPRGRGGPRGP